MFQASTAHARLTVLAGAELQKQGGLQLPEAMALVQMLGKDPEQL